MSVIRVMLAENGGFSFRVLTLDVQDDPFADRGRHAVGRNAQIRSHVGPADTVQVQDVAVLLVDCGAKKDRKSTLVNRSIARPFSSARRR